MISNDLVEILDKILLNFAKISIWVTLVPEALRNVFLSVS